MHILSIVKKSFTFGLFFVFYTSLVVSSSVGLIQKKYQEPLIVFNSLDTRAHVVNYSKLIDLSLSFNESFAKVVTQLRQDIKSVKKEYKKTKSFEILSFLDKLQDLYAFIKKYKLQYEAIIFHSNIKNSYQKMFDFVNEGKSIVDIVLNNQIFSSPKDAKKVVGNVLKEIRQARHMVSKYEDYIHADHIDLKLQNYVYKIELVKLRNAILFDEKYKQLHGSFV